jgi:hypothetical protein
MSNQYGPWATSIHVGGSLQLSAFWQRRMAMLLPTSQTSPTLSRRTILCLVAAGALMIGLPTLHVAVGNQAATAKRDADLGIELVALAAYPSSGSPWWTPNGRTLPETPVDPSPLNILSDLRPNNTWYTVLFRVKGNHDDTMTLGIWRADAGGCISGGHQFRGGKRVGNMVALAVAMPREATRANLTVRVPWVSRNIEFHDISLRPGEKTNMRVVVPGAPAVAGSEGVMKSKSGEHQKAKRPVSLPELDGDSSKGLEIECRLAKTKFVVGEPINIECTIKNTTNGIKPIGLHGGHFRLVQANKEAWQGGVVPKAIQQLDRSILIASGWPRPANGIHFIPAHESILITLTYKEGQPEKFKGRVVYDPIRARGLWAVPAGTKEKGPPWKNELVSSNQIEYEVVAAAEK